MIAGWAARALRIGEIPAISIARADCHSHVVRGGWEDGKPVVRWRERSTMGDLDALPCASVRPAEGTVSK